MKKGAELFAWAQAKATEACGKDSGLLGHTGWTAATVAIAEAYMQGGIDALADEIAHIKSQAVEGAVAQADGSAT